MIEEFKKQASKLWFSMVVVFVVMQVAMCYGSSLEFYGTYANNNNKLIEMAVNDKNKSPYEFGPKVQFLVFQKQAEMYANSLTIERAIFVRTVNNPGMDGKQPPENVNTWKPRRNGAVETRTKPVAGQPDQIYVVPRSPLAAGVYIVKGEGIEIGKFYVDKARVTQNLERGEDCIDIIVGSGWESYAYDIGGGGGKAIPCSNAEDERQKANAKAAFINAVAGGNIELTKTLLAKGADVNVKNDYGGTVLIEAAGKGYTEIVKMLLAKGADVNAMTNEGGTALGNASSNGNTAIVKILLNKGADVKGNNGNAALSYAVRNGNTEIVNMLLEKGADVSIKDSSGKTVFDYTQDPKILEMLRAAAQKVDKTVADNDTKLMWQQGEGGSMNWDTAIAYCNNLSFAGYNDWRLPNIEELKSIIDVGKTPAINKTNFPDAKLFNFYWSSTDWKGGLFNGTVPSLAWAVNFNNGTSDGKKKTETRFMRCVRSGQ